MLKNKRSMAFTVILATLIAGCAEAGPKTRTGAVAGGLVGATAGGIIGHQRGRGLEGAAVGAAIGAVSGLLIGSSMDQADQRALAVNPNHLTVIKIAEMGRQGVPDSVIIGEIQRTRSVYQLNSEIIAYLHQNRVSNRVIDYMLQGGG